MLFLTFNEEREWERDVYDGGGTDGGDVCGSDGSCDMWLLLEGECFLMVREMVVGILFSYLFLRLNVQAKRLLLGNQISSDLHSQRIGNEVKCQKF